MTFTEGSQLRVTFSVRGGNLSLMIKGKQNHKIINAVYKRKGEIKYFYKDRHRAERCIDRKER